MKRLLMAWGLLVPVFAASAGGVDPEFEFFGFRISAGYQCGINLKTSLTTTVPAAGAAKAAAYARATGASGKYESDDGGFIYKDDGGGDPSKTTYWQVPSSAVSVDGANSSVVLKNAFQDVARFSDSDDDIAHGAHIELATTIARDGDWGMDAFVGFSFMKGVDCFQSSGSMSGNSGVYRTSAGVPTADLMTQGYLDWGGNPVGGTIGPGRMWQMGDGPQLGTDLGEPTLVPGSSGVTSFRADGEYSEYDIYGGFRLWYCDEEYKWFKVTSTFGLGCDYGDFEYHMTATGPDGASVRSSYGHGKWDVYGLLGLGVLVNFWDFDLSFDALWRYAQDELKIDSPYVKGEIERPDFIFRASLGYNF